jgi:hypothetical protein
VVFVVFVLSVSALLLPCIVLLPSKTPFNQDIGNWDISSLTDAIGMFDDSKMSIANMDNTLRGWAKLDTCLRF